MFWYMLVAVILLSPALFIFGPGAIGSVSQVSLFGLEVPVILWVVGLGVGSTGVAYFFITIALNRISANVPSVNIVYGGVLLLASGFWLARTMMQQKSAEAEHAVGD